ncbi:hypothetical protein AX17_002496 [Amanita inopinata Kibby_2008]|nr:hypothetical protein AX17_002496 [Amanita inopinata Kibby_2008]
MMVYVPSTCSPTFRTELARLVSPLKRVRPRVPFWNLGAHRVPTLWSLYRGLLRNAPTEHIRFRVRVLFRQNQHRTGIGATIKYLKMGYKWLDVFNKAKQGDEHLQNVLRRYSALIAVRREKAYWMYLGHKERAWQLKLRSRPILTGFFRASTFNPHLPRLKPQPLAMTMIIAKRKGAIINRHRLYLKLRAQSDYIRSEQAFEEGVVKDAGGSGRSGQGKDASDTVFAGVKEWLDPISTAGVDLSASETRAQLRARQPVPEWLKQSVKKARTECIANKTRELERERRGEVLPRTLRRRAAGPPAHILCKMTPERRALDKAIRSVSEVGYVAMAKKRLGVGMRESDAWCVEVGSTRGKEGRKLKRVVSGVRAESRRRRRAVGLKDAKENLRELSEVAQVMLKPVEERERVV